MHLATVLRPSEEPFVSRRHGGLLGLEEAELAPMAAALPGVHAYRPVDVTYEATMARTAAEVTRRLGPPSVVVANAGVAVGGPFLKTAPETWNRTVEINLPGTAVTARVFLPGLLHTRGHCRQIPSLTGITAAPLLSAYCAAKSGAEAFAHSPRAEVAHRGVAVGITYLSWTGTEMIRTADAHPATRLLRTTLPWPVSTTYRVEAVAAYGWRSSANSLARPSRCRRTGAAHRPTTRLATARPSSWRHCTPRRYCAPGNAKPPPRASFPAFASSPAHWSDRCPRPAASPRRPYVGGGVRLARRPGPARRNETVRGLALSRSRLDRFPHGPAPHVPFVGWCGGPGPACLPVLRHSRRDPGPHSIGAARRARARVSAIVPADAAHAGDATGGASARVRAARLGLLRAHRLVTGRRTGIVYSLWRQHVAQLLDEAACGHGPGLHAVPRTRAALVDR
ncbi:SDR family NAD(P)-dependent oxidoreductase [Streptomyces benahoarensis]|uniref:SDR family NAD(P)-dependent oxidoreductase n=1 Tax=Streptomyces benahoarensis TaxID=2595054 RepID=UPI0032DF1251